LWNTAVGFFTGVFECNYWLLSGHVKNVAQVQDQFAYNILSLYDI